MSFDSFAHAASSFDPSVLMECEFFGLLDQDLLIPVPCDVPSTQPSLCENAEIHDDVRTEQTSELFCMDSLEPLDSLVSTAVVNAYDSSLDSDSRIPQRGRMPRVPRTSKDRTMVAAAKKPARLRKLAPKPYVDQDNLRNDDDSVSCGDSNDGDYLHDQPSIALQALFLLNLQTSNACAGVC